MRRWILLLTVVSMLLGACSGDGGSSEPATSTTGASTGSTETEATTTVAATEPATEETTMPAETSALSGDCLLLTTEELDAATGNTFGEGTFNEDLSNEHQIVCDWVSTGDAFATAQVLIADWSYEPTKEGTAAAFTVVDVTVPGASQAYATEEGSLVGMEVDGRYVQVAYIPSGPGNVLDATTQLAATVVSRMG